MYSIVIVDDEATIADGLANLFPWHEMGFDIQAVFHDPQSLLAYLEDHKTDVLVCDIEMPDINGVQIAERLQKSGVRIVFISGYQKYEYLRGAILNHVEDYLLKPVKYAELSECFWKIKEQLDAEHHVPEETHPRSFYEQVIQNVQAYVDENFRTATLDKAAECVHLSPSYLSKIYKGYSGQGFQDYLTQVKMNKACEYLRNIEYKNYDVAYCVGYDNPKNFSRSFKKYFGKTPSEYRANYDIIDEEP